MNRWTKASILAGYNGTCEALFRCGECGALVSRYDRDRHDQWHEAMPVPRGWLLSDDEVAEVMKASFG